MPPLAVERLERKPVEPDFLVNKKQRGIGEESQVWPAGGHDTGGHACQLDQQDRQGVEGEALKKSDRGSETPRP